MTPQTRTRIATVIVTYNGAPWIRGCLQSLRDSTITSRVIVVDNQSLDDTREIIEQEFPDVELIRLPVNGGFGIGNNEGIARALATGAEFVFLLNQDAYVLPHTLAELESFLDRETEFGVVSPLHCSPHEDQIDARTYTGYLRNFAAQYLCDAALGRVRGHYRIRGINAAAWFVRATVFRTVGGFDPLFFMYGEDDDLIRRLERHRVPFALLPSTRIVHLRESPAAPGNPGPLVQIARRASRLRSQLVVRIKNAEFSVIHMLCEIVAHGLLMPFAECLVDRDVRQLLGHWWASVQCTVQLRAIRRHARLTARRGPHFLPLSKYADPVDRDASA